MKFKSGKTYIDLEYEAEKKMLQATKEILQTIFYRMNEDSVLSSDDYGLYADRVDIESAIDILRTLCEYDDCYIE